MYPWPTRQTVATGSRFETSGRTRLIHEKSHPKVAFHREQARITWQRRGQQPERQRQQPGQPEQQMRQQPVREQQQRAQQREREREPGLLFCRKQPGQQPGGWPAGAIFSF